MDAERARAMLLAMPQVTETVQWGESLVYWVGDKRLGGRMFAVMHPEAPAGRVIAFAASPERGAELREREGLIPAPYLARAGWVAAERWEALRLREWQEILAEAHALVMAKLPRRAREAFSTAANPPNLTATKRSGRRNSFGETRLNAGD